VAVLAIATNWSPSVSIYTGTALTNLNGVSSAASYSAQANFNAVAGTNYQIAVDGPYGGSGNFNLILTAPPSVSIASPTNGALYFAPASVLVSASATDP
jgi:hypothetical protein